MRHHGDLLEAEFWQRKQARIRAGLLEDVFPYPESMRFRNRYHQPESAVPTSRGADAPVSHPTA